MGSSQTAPGPPGHFLFGHLGAFRRDVLGLLLSAAREHGDVVRFRLGPQVVHLVNHPDTVEHVLHKHSRNYDKATRSARYIRSVCGDSLLSSNGADWQRQRRLLQPYFHHQSVQRFAGLMVECGAAMCAAWAEHCSSGQALDVASEMMRLTYTVAARALFSTDKGPDAEAIERAMQVILPHTFGRLQSLWSPPPWVPTARNRGFRAALLSLDEIVYRLIEQHRAWSASDRPCADLLGMLLNARDEATGAGLTERQIRDQTITFLLAGHETTSNALTWTFYLLARHAEVQDRLRNEIHTQLHGEMPKLETLSKIPEVRQVIHEAMRLYPPIWIIERRVIAEDVVGGYCLPRGSAVVVCPFTLHRHPGFWESPDEFRPERFAGRWPEAYIPFGAGPRYCIGSEFAMLEAQLITILVLQAFRLKLVPAHPVEPWPGITLRARHGVLVNLER